MKIILISRLLSVSSEISEDDVSLVANYGFKSIINNCSNDKEGQLKSKKISAAAQRAGLAYSHIPLPNKKNIDDGVKRFSRTLDRINKPVLAFCTSGIQSATLWALSEASRTEPEIIIRALITAGFNLENIQDLRSQLEIRWYRALWEPVNFAISF